MNTRDHQNTVTSVERILLDLDDVFNSFTKYAMRYLGCRDEEFPVECGYDIVAAINLTHPTNQHWTAEQVWGILGNDLWDHMPMSDIHEEVLEYSVDIVGRDQVFICSTLTNNIHCTTGKLKWIQRNLPKWLQGQYIFTSKKSLLANRHTLLVDDYHGNTMAFEEKGGQALLVPRPWNPYNRYNTKSFVVGALNYIKNHQR